MLLRTMDCEVFAEGCSGSGRRPVARVGGDGARSGGGTSLCKFFDNMGPIPHHMHQSDEFAKLMGHKGKPEAYYFPPQYNQLNNNFPHTYMGLEPGTTKDSDSRVSGALEPRVTTGY